MIINAIPPDDPLSAQRSTVAAYTVAHPRQNTARIGSHQILWAAMQRRQPERRVNWRAPMTKAVRAMDRRLGGDCIVGQIPFVFHEYVAQIAGARGP
jgi:hypothetical protein